MAFHNLDFIKQNLASSIHGSGNGFPTYQCYWVLSVMDFYHYTGDTGVLADNRAEVASLLGGLVKRTLPLRVPCSHSDRLRAEFGTPWQRWRSTRRSRASHR